MVKKASLYFSEKHKVVVESLWNGDQDLQCDGEPMVELQANTANAAAEEHVPVIERDGNKVTVRVGETPHPMDAHHYILFVEVLAGNKIYRHDFKEGDTVAEATFLIEAQDIKARAFCNLHGLWETS